LGVGVERCEDKGEKSALKFVPNSNYHNEEETSKSTKAHYPSNTKPSFNPKREVRKKTPSLERKLLFACFVTMLVTWMNFASVGRESIRGTLIMLETHIVISSLVFRLVFLLMLCLSPFMDLTNAHMVLIHERTTLCLDALVMTHVLTVVIVSHIGMVFLLEDLILTLSLDTWMVHVFSIGVHIPLVQMARYKRL
jgi:hypothetical protein